MQTQLKIKTDKIQHFLNILEMSNKAGNQSSSIEVITTENENDLTLVTIEFAEAGDLFELGKLFSQVKADVKFGNTTMTPGAGRDKPSFLIEFK